ncbi:MAG: hypothetical protein Q8867_09770 [Bacteroidota bacterium]|nr:hypothetical protein [Bacteroidota bacterium]
MKITESPLEFLYFTLPNFDQVNGKRHSFVDHKKLTAAISDEAVNWSLVQVGFKGDAQIYFALNKANPDEMEEESEICLDDYDDCFNF